MRFSAHDIDNLIHAQEVLEQYIGTLVEDDGWAPNYEIVEEIRYTVRRLREMENEARNEVFPV